MLKKILLGFAALLLLAVTFVGWRLWPIYLLAQEISPSTAPEEDRRNKRAYGLGFESGHSVRSRVE